MPNTIRGHAARLACLFVLPIATAGADPGPYAVDDDYAAGTFTDDAFASDSTLPHAFFEGRKVLRVNGNVLVAARVKHPGGTQANGMWNLGLVRYNGTGTQRLAWNEPTPSYAHYNDEYIVYPNSTEALIHDVRDMRVLGDRIYVLVDMRYTNAIDLSVARVLVFDLDGAFITSVIPFSANGPGVADTPTLGGGLATYTDIVASKRYLVVVGTRFHGGTGHGRGVFTRYELVETGLGAQLPMVALDTSACWSTTWECHVRGIEANSLYSPKLYVAMAFRTSTASADWNIVVSRIGVDGAGDPSWDPNNVSWGLADGGDGRDWPMGLEVRTPPTQGPLRDDIYVVSESARNCQSGIGVIRFDHDGNRVGSRLIGGDTSTGQACDGSSRRFDRPQAIVANATNTHTAEARLAVVGYTGITYVNGPPTNATFTVFDADLQTAGILNVRHPVDAINDFGLRFPSLFGVVSDGDGSFTAAGSLIHGAYGTTPAALHGKSTVATIGFAADVGVFADGFE